jgi:hypothetical protein
MKIFSRRALALGFLLLFALVFVMEGATGFAKEPKSKKAKNVNLAKTARVDVLVPFDGNRIYNYIVNNGDIVTDNYDGSSGFYWPSVPRTSRSQTQDDLRGENTADYSSGVWICGTVNGQPRTAIVEYSSEFIAGKILPDGKRDDGTLEKYRIYKIMKGDGPGVKDYDEWPKVDGAPTTADGKPLLTGDQTLWFVMNDLEVSRHNSPISGSPPIGLEVQTSVFGFNAANPLGDIMFVSWRIINKGTGNLDSAYIAVWDDPDLGDASDDLVGCDTTLGLGFVYNGDPNDGQYGSHTPALGFDFFQGPEVPPHSGRRLKMTSFAKYTNGAPAGQGDPDNVQEVYNYMTGFWQNGQPFVDPTTGKVTKFIHAGDPATRKGWLDSAPGDRRFLMASGPFVLAKGDTQTIVGAKVIAPGANPSSSIAALRFYDSFAQSAFDNKFDIVQAPAPKVSVTRLDQEVVLNWNESYAALEAFDQRGYKFQGYKVYQGASLTGPYQQIAIYDLADGLQNIYDTQFDPETGLLVDKPVVIASDAGVQRFIAIKTDAIFNSNQSLSNYRDYYFAVTSYVVNLDAVPKVIESPIAAFRVSPSVPDYGVVVTTKTGSEVDFQHPKGTGDGNFYYKVIDPAEMVTANYRVTWNDDSTPADQNYTWNLYKNGSLLLSNVQQTGRDSEGNPNDNAPIIDGVQIQMLPAVFINPPEFIFSYTQIVDVNKDNGPLWVEGTYHFGDNDRAESIFGGVGSSDLNKLKADLEFRFTGKRVVEGVADTTIVSGGQMAIIRSRSAATAVAVVRVPFEVWDIQSNKQINAYITERNVDGKSPWGNSGVPQYWRIRGRNYITVNYTPYSDAITTTSFARVDTNSTWGLIFDGAGEWNSPRSEWNTGDVVRIKYADPTFPKVDEYTFSTSTAIVSGLADVKAQMQKVNIVPNPYWAQNPGERDPVNRYVRITNMPGSGATVRIFTLAGELVRVIDDAARTQDGTNGLQYANWDLRNDSGIPVASGIYIVHIDVPGVGSVVRKAVVVMPEERLDVY